MATLESMSESWRPSPGSLIGRWLADRPHRDSFDCGVRVLSGVLAGERSRWSYRRSAVDPLSEYDAGVILHHGTKVILRLALAEPPLRQAAGLSAKLDYAVIRAVDSDTQADVEVSCSVNQLFRFGLDLA
jgi:hypothetical protein